MGTFYHLFAHDVDGILGTVLRSVVYAVVPRPFEDDKTFALVITGIFMQVTGILMLPEFMGPSFSVFLAPIASITKLFERATPIPSAKDVRKPAPPKELFHALPEVSGPAGKKKNKSKNKKKTS